MERIEQRVFFVDQNNKNTLLLGLIKQARLKCILVFTRTKHRANKVTLMLTKNNIQVAVIHGNKSQNQRTEALHNFKSGRTRVLVATDLIKIRFLILKLFDFSISPPCSFQY